MLLRSDLLSTVPEIGHAFTTRIGGVSTGLFTSLNLTNRTGDTPRNVARNRDIACQAAGAPERLAYCRQMLGAEVVFASTRKPEADAMVTDEPGLTTMTFSADCNLLLLVDRHRLAIANVHASRRGTRGEIARKTVEAMTARFGTDPSNIVAVVGPSIGACCYELNPEPWADWHTWGPQFLDGWKLDLKAANKAQLVAAGVPEASIEVSDLCTRCRPDWFYSYRRDGEHTGRFGAMIWLR
jgi:hypothetical protein